MNILSFLLQNWDNILVTLILVVSLVIFLEQWIKKNGPLFQKMTLQEKLAYIKRLLQNLVPMALVLVTDAEIEFGGGTGPIKRSYVIAELYKLIPDEYKKYITEQNLDEIIDKALDEAERLWTENQKIKTLVYSTPNGRWANK